MERMLVVIFGNEKKAFEGASALRQLEAEGSITVYAGAVVAKNADGTTTPKQVDDLDPVGTLLGSSVGALIGLLGGPVGVAIGAASGLTLGVLSDVSEARVGDDFVEEVAETLLPSSFALIAEVEEDWTAPVDTRMEALGGVVIRRALWDVREQMHKEHIAAMQADLAQLKAEIKTANAERKAKLQARADRLQARIDEQQKKAQTWFEAFQARRRAKRDAFKTNAAAAGHALRELAKTPPL
ncbi:MAG TPA: DUF1269 domain-containing protein [Polyangia bacterium]|nr:DUF1269 domain-containing protein [Polyangia bacterium]